MALKVLCDDQNCACYKRFFHAIPGLLTAHCTPQGGGGGVRYGGTFHTLKVYKRVGIFVEFSRVKIYKRVGKTVFKRAFKMKN